MPETTQRIVPGAPPPPPLSKSQKKKRKITKKSTDEPLDVSSAALIEKAPVKADVEEGAVAEELVAQPDLVKAPTATEELGEVATSKPSPMVELLNKRIRVFTKKIVSGIMHFMASNTLSRRWSLTPLFAQHAVQCHSTNHFF